MLTRSAKRTPWSSHAQAKSAFGFKTDGRKKVAREGRFRHRKLLAVLGNIKSSIGTARITTVIDSDSHIKSLYYTPEEESNFSRSTSCSVVVVKANPYLEASHKTAQAHQRLACHQRAAETAAAIADGVQVKETPLVA